MLAQDIDRLMRHDIDGAQSPSRLGRMAISANICQLTIAPPARRRTAIGQAPFRRR